MYAELAETLLQLVESVQPAPHVGLKVTDAEIELPLEVQATRRGEELVFLAGAPHSRWQAGFLPQVHRGRLKVTLEEA